MTYVYETDGEKCKKLRDKWLWFSVYKNRHYTQTKKFAQLRNLANFEIQPNVVKEKRNFFTLNTTVNGGKTKIDYHIPFNIGVDYDINTPAQQKYFIEHWRCTNLRDAMITCYKYHRSDPACNWGDYSSSFIGYEHSFDENGDPYFMDDGEGGNRYKFGMHFFYNVISDFWVQNRNKLEYANGKIDTGLLDHIMSSGFDTYMEYHKNTGGLSVYMPHLGIKENYLDKSLCGIQQGFYSSNGLGYFVNEYAGIITYQLPSYITVSEKLKQQALITGQQINPPTESEVNESNNAFMAKLDLFLKTCNNTTTKAMVDSILAVDLAHDNQNFPIYCSTKGMTEHNRGVVFNLLQKHYKGKERINDLRSFLSFDKHIFSLKGSPQLKLENKWEGINRIIDRYNSGLNDDNSDLFGNKYHRVLRYNLYIGEIESILFEEFDSYNRIFLSSPTGSGKTTLAFKYAVDGLNSGKFKLVVICVPKNSCLIQFRNRIVEEHPSMMGRVIDNFDKKRWSKKMMQDKGVIVLSSTPKMEVVEDADLLIVDEAHNIVNFSSMIPSTLTKSRRQIFISATLEAFMIWEDKYRYIRVSPTNLVKKKLVVVNTNDKTGTLERLIKGKQKICIYWQNIKDSKKWLEDYQKRTGKQGVMMNRTTTNEELTVQTIKQQLLMCDFVIITSYFTDGINFNNSDWDIMVIMNDEWNTTPQELFQTSGRFRVAHPKLYLVTKECRYERRKSGLVFDDFFNMTLRDKELKLLDDELRSMNSSIIRNSNRERVKGGKFHKTIKNQYVVKVDEMKKTLFEQRFMDSYRLYSNIRLEYLGKYFDIKEFDDKLGAKVANKNSITSNKEFFHKKHMVLLECIDCDKDGLFIDKIINEPNLSEVDKKHITDNVRFFENIGHCKNEMSKCGIDYLKNHKKFMLTSSRWRRYMDDEWMKYNGSVDYAAASDKLSGKDMYIRELQEKFYQMVNESNVCEKRFDRSGNEYLYFSVCRVMQFMEDNHKWGEFKRNGSELFTIGGRNKDKSLSLGKFIKTIRFHFKPIMINENRYFKIIA